MTEPVIWLWGDSLSSPSNQSMPEGRYPENNAWPVVLQREWYCDVNRLTRGGLALVELTVPGWATAETGATYEPDILCIHLGTNDALKGVEQDQIREWLNAACEGIAQAKKQSEAVGDTLRCTVVKPPSYTHNPGMREQMRPVRSLFKAAQREWTEIQFVNLPWSFKGETPYQHLCDKWHPDEDLHYIQACYMASVWGLKRRRKKTSAEDD